MGLLTGLLTLPLAPVRGTIWIAEQLALQAVLNSPLEREHRFRTRAERTVIQKINL